jgi:predicted GIY-YIG superfamily endonuclease
MQSITDSPVYCYSLIDPRDNAVRYIGITKNVAKRVQQHIGASKHEKNHKANWLKQLAREDLTPEVRIFNECRTLEEAQHWERFWIAAGRKVYHWSLTNLNGGGEGQFNPTPEMRAKMGESQRARFKDPEQRAAASEATRAALQGTELRAHMSETTRALWDNPEFRSRVTEGVRAAMQDPERRAYLSETSRALWNDPEFRARVNEAQRIALSDPEYRVRQSDNQRANWEDPEYRAWQIEMRRSSEFRANLSEATRAAWTDPDKLARKSEAMRAMWADPEKRARRSASLRAAWARRKAKLAGEDKDNKRYKQLPLL